MNDSLHSQDKHPLYDLLLLTFFCFLGGMVFSFLGVLIFSIFFNEQSLLDVISGGQLYQNIYFLRCVQIFSSIGIFIFGPVLFTVSKKYPFTNYYQFYKPTNPILIILSITVLFAALPLIEWLTAWNNKMVLPESLKGIEIWMRQKEDEAMTLTKQLLIMKSYTDFAINLLMIAIIPAIGEELLFRGGIQQIFGKWFGNPHIAIWLAAIIFSAIHVQFYGFIPRMFLGALFGYLLFWGKSLWYPIIGHFINNGSAVIMAFIYQQNGKGIEEIEKTDNFPAYGYLFSALFTLVLLYNFYQKSRNRV
ncbi:CPBP family intramembrane glutamic endopeptidase [Pseudopedobacter sp.]|uniref:CPBP family intramembrane glutamic endopeptidase n=1 Tax=Pseudopedobacter sp. TaxID=1936787 RepID=UPI00333F459A